MRETSVDLGSALLAVNDSTNHLSLDVADRMKAEIGLA